MSAPKIALGLAPYGQVLGALAGLFGAAGVMYVAVPIIAKGDTPISFQNKEWHQLTAERLAAWPRQGAPDKPVLMNPMK